MQVNSLCQSQLIYGDIRESFPLEKLKKPILIITSPGFNRRGTTALLTKQIKEDYFILDKVNSNPELSEIQNWFSLLVDLKPETIIALGGGSVLDSSKVLSMLLHKDNIDIVNNFNIKDIKKVTNTIPIIAIPTTAGSGSEITPFASIWDFEKKIKFSFYNNYMIPKIVVYDSSLLINSPEEILISSGLDAISHALESIWNLNLTPISLAIAKSSLSLSLKNLPLILKGKLKQESLLNLQLASTLAGIAISETKTGIAHSISYPITANYGIPHGIASSLTLPEILEFNNNKDDGRLQDLSLSLNYQDPLMLSKELGDMQSKLISKTNLIDSIKMIDIKNIKNSLITPDRANLNMKAISKDDAFLLLNKAIKRLSL